MKNKKLYRSATDRKLFGVCGGIGEWLGIDPVIVRIIIAFLMLGYGSGVLLYLVLTWIIPINPNRYNRHSHYDSYREYDDQDDEQRYYSKKTNKRKDVTPSKDK